MPESLQSKQSRFARMVAALIVKATELGYEVTFGEAYRTPEQAALNAKSGKGISNSLHTERLAIDLNLSGRDREPQAAWRVVGIDRRGMGWWFR
jgi:uncharacterized protein YcbK (DUF882 family)